MNPGGWSYGFLIYIMCMYIFTVTYFGTSLSCDDGHDGHVGRSTMYIVM